MAAVHKGNQTAADVVSPPLSPILGRVVALEETVLDGAQVGPLLNRIKGLEEAMLGEASGGAMPARVAALEAALS